MRSAILFVVLLVLAVAAFVAYNAFFIVHQTQMALVLEFGNPTRQVDKPGLYTKLPFVQTVEFFDKRILDIEISSKEVIASDQKRLVVDAFARYKITDPLLFFQAVRDEAGAGSRLNAVMDSAMRGVLGSATFIEVVRDRRDELMRRIAERVSGEVKDFGIEVVDVRIKRADLPEANSQAIFTRMQTERQRQAAELRAQGNEQAKRIRATADRQVTVLIAEATRDSERTRGEGDAERNRIYANAFNKDPDFFAFYRSMQAYEEGLKSSETRLVITPNTEFFRYFNNPGGNTNGGSQPAPAAAPASPAPSAIPTTTAAAPAPSTLSAAPPIPAPPAGQP
jgi:modulator of FtsH protease HflC